MKKSGFTLMELLAVIVILALLALVTSGVIVNVIKSSKEKLYKEQLDNIKFAGENFAIENKLEIINNFSVSVTCQYISLTTLENAGLIGRNIKDPRTGSIISNVYVKITTDQQDPSNFHYELVESIENCSEFPGV